MRIEFSHQAEADLSAIFRYGIETHGLIQAERYKGRLANAFRILSDSPKIMPLRQDITPAVRIYPVRKHIIIYTIREDDQTIFVLRVRHSRENWMEQPVSAEITAPSGQ